MRSSPGWAGWAKTSGSQTFDLKPDLIALARGSLRRSADLSPLLVNEKINEACLQQSGEARSLRPWIYLLRSPGVLCRGSRGPQDLRRDQYRRTRPEGRTRPARGREGAGLAPSRWRCPRHRTHCRPGDRQGYTTRIFDPALRIPFYLEERCAAHGVLLRAIATTLAISPPLIISEAEIREIVRVIKIGLDENLDAHVQKEGLL